MGDLVLRQADDALQNIEEQEAIWEGPYTVTKVLAGGSYEMKDKNGKQLPRPWHVSHLKRYFA